MLTVVPAACLAIARTEVCQPVAANATALLLEGRRGPSAFLRSQ